MAQSQIIRCINKGDRYNEHERILNVGGTAADGSGWKQSQQHAIRAIEDGSSSYTVKVGGRTARVIVATSAFGHKYLRTDADGIGQNNLLSLPECP